MKPGPRNGTFNPDRLPEITMAFRDFLLLILVLAVLGFGGYGAWEIRLIEADARRAADSVSDSAAKLDATVDKAVNNAINPLPSLFKKP